jgi:hypothetical protein
MRESLKLLVEFIARTLALMFTIAIVATCTALLLFYIKLMVGMFI